MAQSKNKINLIPIDISQSRCCLLFPARRIDNTPSFEGGQTVVNRLRAIIESKKKKQQRHVQAPTLRIILTHATRPLPHLASCNLTISHRPPYRNKRRINALILHKYCSD